MAVVTVFQDTDELVAAATRYVLQAAAASIAQHDVFTIALSGGSTPRKLYEKLAATEGVEWSKWQFFMGDERFVALDGAASNQKMATDALLSKIPINNDQIHAVPVDEPTPSAAAEVYTKHIAQFFGAEQLPAFDLILLGMGSDGHTASLFPGKPALKATDTLVVASEPGVLPPPVERVSFTFPLINAAHRVLFMAAGPDKAEAFAAVQADLHKDPAEASTPAGKVRPINGELRWYVDQAAAGS